MSDLTNASWITGGLGLLGNILTGTLGLAGSAYANRENRKQWKRQREFAIHIMKNAHQYEVKDLRKAGLNPILSATGGNGATANVPSAAPQQAPDVPDFGGTLVDALNSAAALKNAETQAKTSAIALKNAETQERAIASQSGVNDSQIAVNSAQVEKINAEKRRIEQEIAIKSSMGELGKLGGEVSHDTFKNTRKSFNLLNSETFSGLKHFFLDPSGKGPDTYRPVSGARGQANQAFVWKRQEELNDYALKSKQKEIWTTSPSVIGAFVGSRDWIPIHGKENKDGSGVLVFKNIKNGFVKTIHYK